MAGVPLKLCIPCINVKVGVVAQNLQHLHGILKEEFGLTNPRIYLEDGTLIWEENYFNLLEPQTQLKVEQRGYANIHNGGSSPYKSFTNDVNILTGSQVVYRGQSYQENQHLSNLQQQQHTGFCFPPPVPMQSGIMPQNPHANMQCNNTIQTPNFTTMNMYPVYFHGTNYHPMQNRTLAPVGPPPLCHDTSVLRHPVPIHYHSHHRAAKNPASVQNFSCVPRGKKSLLRASCPNAVVVPPPPPMTGPKYVQLQESDQHLALSNRLVHRLKQHKIDKLRRRDVSKLISSLIIPPISCNMSIGPPHLRPATASDINKMVTPASESPTQSIDPCKRKEELMPSPPPKRCRTSNNVVCEVVPANHQLTVPEIATSTTAIKNACVPGVAATQCAPIPPIASVSTTSAAPPLISQPAHAKPTPSITGHCAKSTPHIFNHQKAVARPTTDLAVISSKEHTSSQSISLCTRLSSSTTDQVTLQSTASTTSAVIEAHSHDHHDSSIKDLGCEESESDSDNNLYIDEFAEVSDEIPGSNNSLCSPKDTNSASPSSPSSEVFEEKFSESFDAKPTTLPLKRTPSNTSDEGYSTPSCNSVLAQLPFFNFLESNNNNNNQFNADTSIGTAAERDATIDSQKDDLKHVNPEEDVAERVVKNAAKNVEKSAAVHLLISDFMETVLADSHSYESDSSDDVVPIMVKLANKEIEVVDMIEVVDIKFNELEEAEDILSKNSDLEVFTHKGKTIPTEKLEELTVSIPRNKIKQKIGLSPSSEPTQAQLSDEKLIVAYKIECKNGRIFVPNYVEPSQTSSDDGGGCETELNVCKKEVQESVECQIEPVYIDLTESDGSSSDLDDNDVVSSGMDESSSDLDDNDVSSEMDESSSDLDVSSGMDECSSDLDVSSGMDESSSDNEMDHVSSGEDIREEVVADINLKELITQQHSSISPHGGVGKCIENVVSKIYLQQRRSPILNKESILELMENSLGQCPDICHEVEINSAEKKRLNIFIPLRSDDGQHRSGTDEKSKDMCMLYDSGCPHAPPVSRTEASMKRQ